MAGALHCAAAKGHDKVVRLLVEKGADTSAPDRDGDTPLLAAALAGNESVI